MQRLLIIDDDIQTVQVWQDYFEHRGYHVVVAHNTPQGVEMARSQHPDCILLDVRFDQESDEAGYYACQKIREFYSAPIIMLSAYKVEPLEKVQGLESGATSYLEKTVSLRELASWIEAHVRSFGQRIYRVGTAGQIEVDTAKREIRKNGQPVSVTQTEYKLLAYLAAHNGQAQGKEDLLDLLYDDDLDANESRLTTHIYNLRRALEDDPRKPLLLLTVHGFGYRLS